MKHTRACASHCLSMISDQLSRAGTLYPELRVVHSHILSRSKHQSPTSRCASSRYYPSLLPGRQMPMSKLQTCAACTPPPDESAKWPCRFFVRQILNVCARLFVPISGCCGLLVCVAPGARHWLQVRAPRAEAAVHQLHPGESNCSSILRVIPLLNCQPASASA